VHARDAMALNLVHRMPAQSHQQVSDLISQCHSEWQKVGCVCSAAGSRQCTQARHFQHSKHSG
jgi:hypothetical protein